MKKLYKYKKYLYTKAHKFKKQNIYDIVKILV